jgi:hypothetical protein
MASNNKAWVNFALGVVALVIIGAILIKLNKPKTTVEENSPAANQNISPEQKTKTTISAGASVWEGLLKASDNSQKGNLMLVTNGNTIYMYTSRDFSPLIGKEVVVTYEGDSGGFVLGDIVEKSQTLIIPEPK